MLDERKQEAKSKTGPDTKKRITQITEDEQVDVDILFDVFITVVIDFWVYCKTDYWVNDHKLLPNDGVI